MTSQPWIDGVHPDWPDLKAKLESQGLESESPEGRTGVYVIHDEVAGDISVYDIKPDNVVLEENTHIAQPIDVHFYFDSHEDRKRALDKLKLLNAASSNEEAG